MALDYNNILTIHIPRNGTHCIIEGFANLTPCFTVKEYTSSKYGIDENSIINQNRKNKAVIDGRFDTFLELKNKFDVSQFTIVTLSRNPFERAYSLYREYMRFISNGLQNVDVFTKVDVPFSTFLQKIQNNGPFNPEIKSWINKTQSWFLKNEQNAIDSSINIFKLENLSALRQFLGTETYPNYFSLTNANYSKDIHLTHIKESQFVTITPEMTPEVQAEIARFNKIIGDRKRSLPHRYTYQEMIGDYTSECLNLVRTIYAEDFINLNYTTNHRRPQSFQFPYNKR